jgi:hypothetical protein
LRKFSWEEDYDEAGPMPVVKRKLSRDENVEKVETIEVVANKMENDDRVSIFEGSPFRWKGYNPPITWITC